MERTTILETRRIRNFHIVEANDLQADTALVRRDNGWKKIVDDPLRNNRFTSSLLIGAQILAEIFNWSVKFEASSLSGVTDDSLPSIFRGSDSSPREATGTRFSGGGSRGFTLWKSIDNE